MNALERLRGMVTHCPEGSSLLVSVETLSELLAEVEAEAAGHSEPEASLSADLTVAEIARTLSRKPSTVRGWLEAGEIPSAYRMNGREWRVPRSAFAAFLERKRSAPERAAVRTERPRRGSVDLGAWRRVGSGR